ncbi:UDP-N-acetylmuramate dehydrogenase [Flavobacterium sp. CBA20B-1]|uniref:UDP-N-acetylmuramate dehydrogenase n=1 Tax=unclassified Flavobacterium TaxID=196869 RepID=UPI00222482A9|nr:MULTISPECIES: UDP-N-acetylmuramate dehydrogenase [unclassified Flavobacterium]WCM43076.1 UDP-N-acetylmuramate dehydrogenase [Flavobacterium sp. CBA20B-1]
MQFHQSLKTYNTFGIDVQASAFVNITSVDQLKQVIRENNNKLPLFILSGGSNMLLTKNVDALVLNINNKGIKVVNEDADFVWIEAQAGEIWHEFVLHTLAENLGGLENLSLIPGKVGSSPIQNIGAYGVEIKDTFHSLTALNLETLETATFSATDCEFGYRESVFKNKLKDQYIITSVTFKLKKAPHILHTSYGAIQQELELMNVSNPTIKDVSNAVIAIRQSKLPDPKEIGNSGSFFKNPIIGKSMYQSLVEKNPDIPHYPVNDLQVKVPAGWLIEQAGLKGYRKGDAGVHAKQALVLVNYGNATGEELINLAKYVQATVLEKFGIEISPEVNII